MEGVARHLESFQNAMLETVSVRVLTRSRQTSSLVCAGVGQPRFKAGAIIFWLHRLELALCDLITLPTQCRSSAYSVVMR